MLDKFRKIVLDIVAKNILKLTIENTIIVSIVLFIAVLTIVFAQLSMRYNALKEGIVFQKKDIYLDEVVCDFKGIVFPKGEEITIQIVRKDNGHYRLTVYKE